MNPGPSFAIRQTLFISKATPGDDPFALWLAPRLEAQGYRVFADILSFEAGDRWRKKLTDTLQNEAIKMLLCCSDTSLARDGVDEEISIAVDLAKELQDTNFIIPIRLQPFKKVFGIGGLQYIDFEPGWAEGLSNLLDSLARQAVPKGNPGHQINPEWERYLKRLQVTLEPTPEPLTSNWIRVTSAPDKIHFFLPEGSINFSVMAKEARSFAYPLASFQRGFFGFCTPEEMAEHFVGTGRFAVAHSVELQDFLTSGLPALGIEERQAKNFLTQIMRMAWERYCEKRNLLRYEFSAGPSFHISEPLAKIGQKIPWGRQGARRSSMLRNISKHRVWEFGMSAIPSLYPFPHFRLKGRVLFAEVAQGGERGATIEDAKIQHRLRRSVCSPWRNPAWHGRLMAYLELLAQDSAEIQLPLSAQNALYIDAAPIMVTSLVSTKQAGSLDGDAEETDDSTLPPGFKDEEDD